MTPHASAGQHLAAVLEQHRYAHTCSNGVWYNPAAGPRTTCPTWDHLTAAAVDLDRLRDAPHEAAHDTAAAVHVAQGMTGLVMGDLQLEDAEGWTRTARMAIEALAEYLDRDPARLERARAAAARVTP